MAENLPKSIEVPVGLTTFGGLVTELNPSDLPEGVSPDNQDVVYLPGSVNSRPGLARQYPQIGVNTITYLKSYVMPNRTVFNLILDSSGQLWKEDVFNAPRVLVPLTRVTPGSYCSSTTAFGKEYLAFHDGKNPTDIPLQFDGTFIDRVTEDGPATPPDVYSQALDAVLLATYAPGANIAITAMAVSDPQTIEIATGADDNTDADLTHWGSRLSGHSGSVDVVTITTFSYLSLTTGVAHNLAIGDIISVSGMTPVGYNGAWTVAVVVDATHLKLTYNSTTDPGVVTVFGVIAKAGTSLARINNSVQVHCAANHGLSTGMRFTLSGIANTAYDTLATTTRDATGLVTAVQTNGAKMIPGSKVNISGVVAPAFDGVYTVLSANQATKSFTYQQDAALGAGASTGGTVEDIWNGVFTVSGIISVTDFTYNQIGPDDVTSSIGTVTPTLYMEGGARSVVTFFITRQGYLSRPSPPAKIQSSPGQALVIQLPIGPSNVTGRAIGFTGVEGGQYFVIPTQPAVGGTPTLVPDNTSTQIMVDFADNTLFAATAIDIRGNNLFTQRVIRGSLGFTNYSSRLVCWGDRNRIPNLVNMGFDSGYFAATPTLPPGWTINTAGGSLQTNDPRGFAWKVTGNGASPTGQVEQPAYKDVYGVPIISSKTQYTFRLWANRIIGIVGNIVGRLYSPSAGILATATLNISSIQDGGGFISADFDNLTPASIPVDTVLQVYTLNQSIADVVIIDEMEIVFTLNPVMLGAFGSYVNAPEQFDGSTGLVGPTEDNSPVQCSFVFRDLLHFLTLHGFHSTRDSQISEPSGWSVNEITLVCGAASPRCVDVAENFAIWISSPLTVPPSGRGLYIYEGGNVLKISQEIQDIFDSTNPLADHAIWLKNDPVKRRIYCGMPIGSSTAASQILPLDYRELNTASDIADRGPIRISFTGKMICSDLSRKWTRWNIAANCAELMVMPNSSVEMSFGGGNSQAPNTQVITPIDISSLPEWNVNTNYVKGNRVQYLGQGYLSITDGAHRQPDIATSYWVISNTTSSPVPGFGNSYWLNPALKTDDDYGVIVPYYFTYFFVPHEQEQALGVGAHRKLYKRYSIYITGTGLLSVIPHANSMSNPQREALNLTLGNGQFDLGGGLNTQAERCSFRIASKPLPGQTDNSFSLQKFIPTMMQEPVSPIRFGAV